MTPDLRAIARALAEPFPIAEIGFKPQATDKAGGRAKPVAYIDARNVMDRLDAVVGPDGWEDSYQPLEGGCFLCTLRVRLGDHWVTRMDVGGESEQADDGDRRKAAVSDALKRAAVKFGVGRYLYLLDLPWMDYDAKKKTFVGQPLLPAWAIPRKPAEQPQESAKRPETVAEKLTRWDATAAKRGLSAPGEMRSAVVAELTGKWGPKLTDWPPDAEADVKECCAAFSRSRDPITAGQVEMLLAAAKAANVTWGQLCKRQGWPADVKAEALTAAGWLTAMKALGADTAAA